MRKHETYQRSCNNRDIHGFEGPIKVSFGNYTYPIMQDFLRATESQGIPTTDDLQDLVTGHGAEHWLKWINRDTGRRSDSAHAYIHSTRSVHQNLHLLCNNKADKVILEGDRAVGVQVVPTKPLSPQQQKPKVYRARKQVRTSFIMCFGRRNPNASRSLSLVAHCHRPSFSSDLASATQRSSARLVSNPSSTYPVLV